jgi:hypothetical protein
MPKGRGSSVLSHIGAAMLFGALAFGLGMAPAHAQGDADESARDTAREAYNKGRTAYDAGDYENAYESFKVANDALPTPQAQYWIAMSLDKAGRKREALDAYDALLMQADAAKVGQDKLAIARERKRELEAELADEEEPESEPQPEPAAGAGLEAEQEAVPVTPTEPLPFMQQLKPQDNLFEIGLMTGPFFVSRAHKLHDEALFRRAYLHPTWWFGGRAAFFPSKYAGLELEIAHGEGKVRTVEERASFLTYRGHIVGQLADWRLTPYAVFGAGGLRASSDDEEAMGTDTDLMIYFGVGAKLFVNKWVALRLDLREDMTERVDSGMAFSEEILLGVSLTLNRKENSGN